jgi:hypothetical protein
MLLIYFVWKYFSELTKQYQKENSWMYILLGIVVFFASKILGEVLIVFGAIGLDMNIDTMSDFAIGLMALPVGILFTYLLYSYFKKKWSREYIDPAMALDEIGSEIKEDQPLIR